MAEPVHGVATAEASAHARFLAFARRDLDRAYRLAGMILADAGEAEDAVGDALERAWAALDGLREPEDLRQWFDRILINVCRDRLRRRRVVRFVALAGADGIAGEDPFRAALDRHAVRPLLERLTPDERAVVGLHYWAGLRLEEVAVRLGWPLGTVKSRLHRALGRMREAVAEEGGEVTR